MGPAAVRQTLDAQGRYCRKRRREHVHKGRTGEENLIRQWATLMGIDRYYQFEDPSATDGAQWRYKPRAMITEEIVRAVTSLASSSPSGDAQPSSAHSSESAK